MWIRRADYEALLEDRGRLHQALVRVALMEKQLVACEKTADVLKGERDREQRRADTAIDTLLAARGVTPVSPPPDPSAGIPADIFAEDPEEKARIFDRVKAQGLVETLLGEAS
jgi:hypothetical protein